MNHRGCPEGAASTSLLHDDPVNGHPHAQQCLGRSWVGKTLIRENNMLVTAYARL